MKMNSRTVTLGGFGALSVDIAPATSGASLRRICPCDLSSAPERAFRLSRARSVGWKRLETKFKAQQETRNFPVIFGLHESSPTHVS